MGWERKWEMGWLWGEKAAIIQTLYFGNLYLLNKSLKKGKKKGIAWPVYQRWPWNPYNIINH